MSMSSRTIIVGSGPIHAIARSSSVANAVIVDLPPDRIADADVAAIIGSPPSEARLFAAIGLHALNHARSDLVGKMRRAGYALLAIVHRSSHVDESATIGDNALIAAGASIGPACEIGEGAVILDGARVEAGARIGPYAWIGANVVVGFGAAVGAHTIVRPGVNLDAGVPVGHHCELTVPGLRQTEVADCTFETVQFPRSARIFLGGAPARTKSDQP